MFISVLFSALFASSSRAEDGKIVYFKICYYCHEDNLVGAPLIGDVGEWNKRRTKGIEKLYWNTLHGTGHMIERMDRQGYNEANIKRAVDYLLEQSK
ncbi:MAG: c-type cytochrome [Rhodospirillales bacterium]|nr:c-type cytochrome [Rhodospirillales bacterium]